MGRRLGVAAGDGPLGPDRPVDRGPRRSCGSGAWPAARPARHRRPTSATCPTTPGTATASTGPPPRASSAASTAGSGPAARSTRAQLAWWLWTYADQPAGSPDHPFVDVPDGAWYEDGLDWVAAQGIVTGFPGNRFEPKRVSSRAAVARTLYRLEERSPSAARRVVPIPFWWQPCVPDNTWLPPEREPAHGRPGRRIASRRRIGAVWTRDAPLPSCRPGRARRRPPRPDPRHRHER